MGAMLLGRPWLEGVLANLQKAATAASTATTVNLRIISLLGSASHRLDFIK